MELYLMRHAEALPTGGKVRSDDERPLSARGWEQARSIARQLETRGVALGSILTSPLRRTRETSVALAEVMGITPEPVRLLAPSGGVPPLQSILARKAPTGGVLLVGHQPDMGLLAASLGELGCAFSPASLAAFRQAPGGKRWELRFILTPESSSS